MGDVVAALSPFQHLWKTIHLDTQNKQIVAQVGHRGTQHDGPHSHARGLRLRPRRGLRSHEANPHRASEGNGGNLLYAYI